MRRRMASLLLMLITLISMNGCSDSVTSKKSDETKKKVEVPDQSGEIYDSKKLLDIRIDIKKEHWDKLRIEQISTDVFGAGCPKKPGGIKYTYYPADISIDGKKFSNVGLRKKGFFGSQSTTRPSIKVKFQEYEKDLTYKGEKRLTLNNNKQDPGLMKTCLSYMMFRKAGIAAPRCNFARVHVNGNFLGIFSNVEPIKKPFLQRNFGDDSGNLYEGAIADFRPIWKTHIEKKTNEKAKDYSDVDKLIEALKVPDDKLLENLGKHLDIDAFIKFWAMEVLIAHWDGYNGNNNNFYVYHNPKDKKFHFIPWGTDGTWGEFVQLMQPPSKNPIPTSVLAQSMISKRLYDLPETKEKYKKQMLEYMKEVWDAKELNKEIDRLEKDLGTYYPKQALPVFKKSLEALRKFVDERKDKIEKELSGPKMPVVEIPMREIPCFGEAGEVEAKITTKWSDIAPKDPMGAGDGTFKASYAGVDYKAFKAGGSANPDDEDKNKAALIIPAIEGGDIKIFLLAISMPKFLFKKGATIPFGPRGAEGALLYLGKGAPNKLQLMGYLIGGSITLSEASLKNGEKVEATIKTKVFRLGGGAGSTSKGSK